MIRLLCVVLLLLLHAPTVFAAEAAAQRVAEVLTAKTLRLEDGTVIRLAALQAPNRARNDKERDDPLGQEAFDTLKKLAEGKEVTLKTIGKPDRHGRTVAQVFVEGKSVQESMLEAGMGWTYTFNDSRKLATPFLAAEAKAEAAKRGIWAQGEYAVLEADKAEGHDGEFRLVQGVPKLVAIKKGKRSYINFGEDWKTDFTLVIEPANLRKFKEEWLQSLVGKEIRVRGWLFTSGGAAIELTHPEQLEVP